MDNEITRHHQTFEELRKTDDGGAEFWFARELQEVLDYSRWEKFERVIDKAKIACENSGQIINDHFHQTVKMVQIGSGAQRKARDYKLSRYACYFNLNIPRYVDTFEEEEEIDLMAVRAEREKLKAELARLEEEMEGYLKELGYGA